MKTGLDNGPLLAQQEIKLSSTDSLRVTYQNLHNKICTLRGENWDTIGSGHAAATIQFQKVLIIGDKTCFHMRRSLN